MSFSPFGLMGGVEGGSGVLSPFWLKRWMDVVICALGAGWMGALAHRPSLGLNEQGCE